MFWEDIMIQVIAVFQRTYSMFHYFINLLCRFLNLSQPDLIACTGISNQIFIEYFLKNYITNPQATIHLSTSRILPYNTPIKDISSSQVIFKMLRYAHTSQPQFYLNCTSKSHQTILDWLQRISNKQVFNISQRSMDKKNPQQNLLWFNSKTYHKLDQWLANQMERSILRYYFNKNDQYAKLKQFKKYMQKCTNFKDFNYLEMKFEQIDEQFWEIKGRILEEIKKVQQSYALEVQSKILNAESLSNQQKKHHKKPKRERKNMSKALKKSKQVVVISLSRQNQEQFDILYNKQMEQLNRCEEKSIDNTTISHIQKHEEEEVKIVQSSLDKAPQQFQQQAKFLLLQTQNFKENPQINYSNTQTQHQQSEQCHHSQQNTNFRNPQSNQEEGLQLAQSISQTCESSKRRRKRRRNNITKQSSPPTSTPTPINKTKNIYEQFRNKAISNLMNKKFNCFIDELNTKSNSLYQNKIIAFQRVRYFINILNPKIESILFGSNAVGISLPSSDIDIMLLGLQSLSKQEICDYLAQIAIFINAMGWVISCSTYLNAKVPLLKLEIDTSIGYAKPKIKLDYQQSDDPYLSYYLDLRDSSKGSIIKVDITINIQQTTYSPSTQLMRKWLEERPSLQRIILAFKYILSIRGYSQNFKGGIGSYSLFIMIAAYFQHFREERENNCEIFIDILKFYGEDFQNQIKMISISLDHNENNTKKCFYSHEQFTQQFGTSDKTLNYNNSLKLIDPLNRKLISSSFNQYNYIKAQWRRIRSDILKIQQKVQEQIYSCFANENEIERIYSNTKSFQKWVNKVYSRIEFSIGDIFHGIN